MLAQDPHGHQDDTRSNQQQQQNPPTIRDAIHYIHKIKSIYSEQPDVYTRFESELVRTTSGMADVDLGEIIRSIYNLFDSNEALLLGFNNFLPPGYRIMVLIEDDVRLAAYSVPHEPNARYILGRSHRIANDVQRQRHNGHHIIANNGGGNDDGSLRAGNGGRGNGFYQPQDTRPVLVMPDDDYDHDEEDHGMDCQF